MNADKLYIDKPTKTVELTLPEYGEIILIVKDGQVVRYETKTTNKLEWKSVLKADISTFHKDFIAQIWYNKDNLIIISD